MAVSRFAPEWSGEEDTPDEVEDTRRGRGRKRKLTGWKAFLRDLVVILVAAIVISFLIKTFLIRSFYIPSPSMNDTLLVNDRIIVNELEPRLVPISRGDVVVFKDPGGWLDTGGNAGAAPQGPTNPVSDFFEGLLSVVGLTAPDSDDHLIKRVIGLPGDHVTCCNDLGQMSVNGVPLDEKAYVKDDTAASGQPFDVTVPKNSLWVMGDNRNNSCDSRCERDQRPGRGFVPESDVVGRAVVITWPTSRWGWLDNYPLVFAEVGKNGSSG